MLDDWNVRAEQRGMHGTISVVGGVDVEGVNADKNYARVDELIREVASQVRVTFEIAIGAPVRVPSRVHEERLALQCRELDRDPVDRALAPVGRADDDAIKIGQRFQREIG
jgi:hypothetical protein